MEPPSKSSNKKIYKTKNTKKNYKTQNTKKNNKTQNPKKNNMNSVPIFSANGAGVITKIQSLVNNVESLGAGIITLQETHFQRKGTLNGKIRDFEFFEAIRK